MASIQVMPNQSMADVILQACGSMEAAMQFCADNNVALSDYPDVGAKYLVSDTALAAGDKQVLKFLRERGIVIGTLGVMPVLNYRVVLKPVMQAVPTATDPPDVTGYYAYNLQADIAAFVNINAIAAGDYPSLHNYVSFETEERVIAGDAPETTSQNAPSLVMSDKLIPYQVPWVAFRGFMMIWSDLSVGAKTATFTDVLGNVAYVSPVLVLDSSTQNVEEYLIADLSVELVSAGHNTVKLRLTRSHAPVAHVDFETHVMTWLHNAAGGTPDPLDPANSNKTIVTASRGMWTFGVGTVYWNGSSAYPPSAFSMVVEVY